MSKNPAYLNINSVFIHGNKEGLLALKKTINNCLNGKVDWQDQYSRSDDILDKDDFEITVCVRLYDHIGDFKEESE